MAVEKIEQRVHHILKAAKKDFLVKLLDDADLSKVIVFTRTKRGADQVVKRLAKASSSSVPSFRISWMKALLLMSSSSPNAPSATDSKRLSLIKSSARSI